MPITKNYLHFPASATIEHVLRTYLEQDAHWWWLLPYLTGRTAYIVHNIGEGKMGKDRTDLASGYELRTVQGYEDTFARFERLLGLQRLFCLHLNDSKYDLNEGRDRHTHIGQGYLGLEPFRLILNDPRLVDLPMLLETPKGKDLQEDVENLALLHSLIA